VPWTEIGMMLPNSHAVAVELKLEGISNEEAAERIVSWLAKNSFGRKVINYKLRDWLFSRQRYWGEPIPIIHWEDGTSTSLSPSELPLLLPKVEDYKPSDGLLSGFTSPIQRPARRVSERRTRCRSGLVRVGTTCAS
jgi:leucyl-tRNA synthetase